jgi:3-dehydroquinate synthase
LDVTYAHLIGLITQTELVRIVSVFETIGLDLGFPIDTDREMERLLKGIEEFREHLGGQLTITLISGIGKKKDVHKIDNSLMKRALQKVNETSNSKVH